MARSKALIFLLVILASAQVAALSFDASIDPDLTNSVRDLQYKDEASLQEVNLTVLNTGSIGCTFQIRTVFNDSTESFSVSKPVWPGEEAFLEARKIFEENGTRKAGVFLQFCGQEKEIEEFNFTSRATDLNTSKINSTSLEVSRDRANISLEVDEGLLLPRSTPYYWEVPSAVVENGTASLTYHAPIFDSREQLSYAVYNRSTGEMEGLTRVDLKQPEPGLWEKRIELLRENSLKVIAVSVLLNILMAVLVIRAVREEK